MRNIFDQYTQLENRLTHAFACCLHHDRNLLKSFLVDVLKLSPPAINSLSIIEQSLPGIFENGSASSAPESEIGNGLPDMIIFDEEGWCVIIESKVASSICKDQIKRHFATIKRRGYMTPHGAVIAVENTHSLIPGCAVYTWSSIYKWVSKFSNDSFWAKELRTFFEILEKTMTDDEYLKDGTITDFIGIPFDKRNPFSYLEAKRILKLMMIRLKQRKLFDPQLDVDYDSGRGAIINQSTVWDIMSFRTGDEIKNFTDAPHFTFGFTEKNLQIMFTLPDDEIKKRLGSLQNIEGTLANLVVTFDQFKVDGSLYTPRLKLQQRHFINRRFPITDGVLEFDLRTISLPQSSESRKVKRQHGWLDSVKALCYAKKSNMQFQIGVYWSYAYLSTLSPEKVLELVEKSCNAMTELVSLIKIGAVKETAIL